MADAAPAVAEEEVSVLIQAAAVQEAVTAVQGVVTAVSAADIQALIRVTIITDLYFSEDRAFSADLIIVRVIIIISELL